MRIEKLTTHIRLQTGSKKKPLHSPEPTTKPEMRFAQPSEMARDQVASLGGDSVSQIDSVTPPKIAKKPDPKNVADRVYDLMLQEIRLGIERGK